MQTPLDRDASCRPVSHFRDSDLSRDPEFEGKVTIMNRVIVVNAMLMLMLGATAWSAALQSTTGPAASGPSVAGATSGDKVVPPDHSGSPTPLDTLHTASNLPLLAGIGLVALGGALTVRSIVKRTS
jgi:hypothetical protein